MKGDQCGFLHQYDVDKMPICRNLLKYGECKELDCPYKHNTGKRVGPTVPMVPATICSTFVLVSLQRKTVIIHETCDCRGDQRVQHVQAGILHLRACLPL